MSNSLVNVVTDTNASAKLLTASQVGKRFDVSANTPWRWSTAGVVARDGSRVRLKSFRFGRKLRFLEADVVEFAKTLAEANARGFAA